MLQWLKPWFLAAVTVFFLVIFGVGYTSYFMLEEEEATGSYVGDISGDHDLAKSVNQIKQTKEQHGK